MSPKHNLLTNGKVVHNTQNNMKSQPKDTHSSCLGAGEALSPASGAPAATLASLESSSSSSSSKSLSLKEKSSLATKKSSSSSTSSSPHQRQLKESGEQGDASGLDVSQSKETAGKQTAENDAAREEKGASVTEREVERREEKTTERKKREDRKVKSASDEEQMERNDATQKEKNTNVVSEKRTVTLTKRRERSPVAKVVYTNTDRARAATQTNSYKPETVKSNAHWPRFLYVTSPENKRLPLSHPAVAKAIMGAATNAKNLRRLKCGDYVVEMDNEKAVKTLLSTTHLANERVTITPHRTLNSCRGVIRSPAFRGLSDKEILDDLKCQGVKNIRRILRREEGHLKPTDILVMSFDSPEIPKHPINYDEHEYRVCPYIPKPMRCFKCQAYGHTQKSCKNKIRCSKCGQKGHSERDCRSQSAHCFHCSGDHPAYSRNCPRWTKEQHILKVQIRQKISNKEARQKVYAEDKGAYANVLRSPKPPKNDLEQKLQTCTTSTQTNTDTKDQVPTQNVDNTPFDIQLLMAKVLSLE